jgi:uncharacterized protein (TIGR02145 family)
MKQIFFAAVLFSSVFISIKAQQINGIKVGNQVWMLSNVTTEIPGSWFYNEDAKLGHRYGRLYTYEAATKVCPSGWRLPTIKEWGDLISMMGGEDKAAPMMLKSSSEGGFNAKLAGLATVGNFILLDSYGAFWTSTEKDQENAWFLYFTPKSGIVTSTYSVKSHGLSVRCLHNVD